MPSRNRRKRITTDVPQLGKTVKRKRGNRSSDGSSPSLSQTKTRNKNVIRKPLIRKKDDDIASSFTASPSIVSSNRSTPLMGSAMQNIRNSPRKRSSYVFESTTYSESADESPKLLQKRKRAATKKAVNSVITDNKKRRVDSAESVSVSESENDSPVKKPTKFFKNRNKKNLGVTTISISKGFNLKFTPHCKDAKDTKAKSKNVKKVAKRLKKKLDLVEPTYRTPPKSSQVQNVSDTENEKLRTDSSEASSLHTSPGSLRSTSHTSVESTSDSLSSSRVAMPSQSSVMPSSQSTRSSRSRTTLSESTVTETADSCRSSSQVAISSQSSCPTSSVGEETNPSPNQSLDDESMSYETGSVQIISSVSNTPASTRQGNVFPIFKKTSRRSPGSALKISPRVTPKRESILKTLKDKDGKEQMILDFGQKEHGMNECQTCGMVYMEKEPEDEAQHKKFHTQMLSAIKYNGWKKERVVQQFPDGSKIILIQPDDKFALKKVEAVLKVVDQDLGFAETQHVQASKTLRKVFLFISNEKKIIGCSVAEPVSQAYEVIPDLSGSPRKSPRKKTKSKKAWSCSDVSVPCKCGINRIWVFSQERKKNIATKLLDCIRHNFFYGYPLEKNEIAFTDPTPDGKHFAAKYCETDSFLVYR